LKVSEKNYKKIELESSGLYGLSGDKLLKHKYSPAPLVAQQITNNKK
jgi:hypothetical protein